MGKMGIRLVHRGQRGFTLIEVLVTIALIGFIAIAFTSFMSAAASSLIHADERTIAESLARSQLEYVKNQTYDPEGMYNKIPSAGIPAGYVILSVNSEGDVVNGAATDPIVGVLWDSSNNKTALTDTGLQMVALVIEHEQQPGQYRVIYTFTNNNDNWADGVEMTLQGYVRNPDK